MCLTIPAKIISINKNQAKVKIGKNVMIGANSTIIAGVTIGNNSTVSACSLVNKDVKPYTFVGGIPIKVIK